MSSYAPVPKITAAALGGAAASLAVWGLDSAGVEAPPAVAAALTALLAFAAGYIKAPAGVEDADLEDVGAVDVLYVLLVVLVVVVLLAVLGVF